MWLKSQIDATTLKEVRGTRTEVSLEASQFVDHSMVQSIAACLRVRSMSKDVIREGHAARKELSDPHKGTIAAATAKPQAERPRYLPHLPHFQSPRMISTVAERRVHLEIT